MLYIPKYISNKLHHVCRPPPATATNQNQPTKYNHQIPTTTIDNNNRQQQSIQQPIHHLQQQQQQQHQLKMFLDTDARGLERGPI